jgi:hypothetical protein
MFSRDSVELGVKVLLEIEGEPTLQSFKLFLDPETSVQAFDDFLNPSTLKKAVGESYSPSVIRQMLKNEGWEPTHAKLDILALISFGRVFGNQEASAKDKLHQGQLDLILDFVGPVIGWKRKELVVLDVSDEEEDELSDS